MKIASVSLYYPPSPGGMERAASIYAKALAVEHDVTVICSNKDNCTIEESIGDIKLIRCARQVHLARQPISLGLADALMAAQPDLIHFHAPNFWAAAVLNHVVPQIPVIVTHHMSVTGRHVLKSLVMPSYHRLVRRARLLVVSSEKNRRSADLPADILPATVLPFGLDPAEFARVDGRIAAFRARFSLPGDMPLIGFLGRLVWYKGLPELLEAMAGLPACRLAIAGDGPLGPWLREQVRIRELQDRILFLGPLSDDDRVDFLHAIDILAFPSTDVAETFGLVQVEAQFCGTPVVATSLPTGASEIVVDGETGLLVAPRDVENLRTALARLTADDALRDAMGRAAREMAKARFSFDRFATRLRGEVRDSIGRGGRPA